MTPRQADLLAYLRGRAPVSPSYREISAELHIGMSRIRGMLDRLARDGHIEFDPAVARSIRLVTAVDLSSVPTPELEAELGRRRAQS
jgi:DNA-binding MarR family transcriptional regulator